MIDALNVAKRFSPYKSAVWLHKLNCHKIVWAYNILSILR